MEKLKKISLVKTDFWCLSGKMASVIAGWCNGRISRSERDDLGPIPSPATMINKCFIHKTRPQSCKEFFCYILECADGTYYVGCTNNLEKRLKEHNNSKSGAHYTKIRRPVVLKYSEVFDTLLGARRREAEIKRWKREKKESLIPVIIPL